MGIFKRGRRKDEVDPVAWAAGQERQGGDEPPAATPALLLPPERGSAEDTSDIYEPTEPAGSEGAAGEDGAEHQPSGYEAPAGEGGGPWDASEVDGPEGYVDLGGIWLPGRDGMELRLEVEEASGRVTAATVQLGASAVQLQAFAAPRSAGIWDEIREEISGSVTRQGGTADEVPGPFGQELLARIPTKGADGRTGHQPARFVGVDGPRWFLRAVFHGAAAYQAAEAAELEGFVRDVVVVRGQDAMAPRELLSLRLPDQVAEAEPAEEEPTRPPLEPFRRGPEITEVR